MCNTKALKHALVLSLLVLPVAAPSALAQGAEAIEEVVVVGSRRQDRSASDSPVPVDVIGGDEFTNRGDSDMDSLLASLIPSYNVSQQPISDAATLVRPANLRGLPPDATLVLVNGKRRHRASVISFLGGGLSDGSQGPDISVIPAIALDRVEVLRDGASAQYGSDAIAGVINFVLKSDPSGGRVEAKFGEFYEGDGQSRLLAGNIGLPLTDAGFANFSLQWREADDTSRSVQRSDAQGLIDAGNTNVANPAQIWGAPEVKDDWTFFGNLGLELGNGSEAYMFGNYSERKVEGGFFFRNPNTRPGVFNLDGDQNELLVADFTGGTGGCPAVPIENNVPNAGALAAVDANPNCFAFNLAFPGGFTPRFGGELVDSSIAFGIRGDMDSGWFYDASVVLGRNDVNFAISNTINPQLAAQERNIPTSYFPGSYTETDTVVNFDMSKPFAVDAFYGDLNFAWGLEYRREQFKIENGDPNSFYVDPILAPQGFGIGSNGFPGFKPEDAGENSRGSWAAYIDMEADLVENFLLGFALRYEDYDDFGDTINGKLAARWQITDVFALRGAVSTGFRAPTVGQANVRNVTTAFTNGFLTDEATLPPTNPISVLKGGVPLDPEESVNLTVGAVFNFDALNLTIDYYNIEVTDRIALTSTQELTDAERAILVAQGIAEAQTLGGVRFFTNDFDTTTQGVDVVLTWPTEWFGGATSWSLIGAWNETTVDEFNPDIIDPDVRVRQLEENLPNLRGALTFNQINGAWRFLARLNYYDGFFEPHLQDATLPINAKSRWFLDAEVAYTFSEAVTVVLGAQNLFDEYPTENPWADIVGAQYPESSPYGFNGGFWYLRAVWDFN